MRSLAVLVRWAVTLSILFVLPAVATAHPGAADQAAGVEPKSYEELSITLEIPRDLASRILPEGEKSSSMAKKGMVELKVSAGAEQHAGVPLAVVDGEALTVGEFLQALRPMELAEGETVSVTNQDPAKVLERLVESRLIVREALEIGLDRLPEVMNLVEIFRRQTLRDSLLQQHLAAVREDEKKVEEIYRELIRESRIKAVLFVKEEDARSFAAGLKKGSKFEDLAEKAAGQGAEIKGGEEGEFVRHHEMAPQMAKTIEQMKNGAVSEVVPAGGKFALIKLLESQSPEDPHARAMARERARNFAQNTALVEYNKVLGEKYIKLDRKLFDSLDFDKKFESLLEDRRVLAQIKGGEPVTVAEVTQELKGRYYHGFQRAIDQGKVQADKGLVLNEILSKRIFLLEALALGLDRTEEFTRKTREYEDSVIFGAFIQKVIIPEVKITLEDLRNHYKKNLADYTYSEMLGIRSLTFGSAKDAQAAMAKLRKGTALRWVESNAAGQVEKGTARVLEFGDNLVATRGLPAGLRKNLEGVKTGDYRYYGDGNGFHYVLHVERLVPSRVQTFEEVQSTILKAVYDQKLQQTLQQWNRKLRESYPVEVYVKGFSTDVL